MRRKRSAAARAREIAKAAVLQGLLPISGIWFTVPFRETITIGRERVPRGQRKNRPGFEAVADQDRRQGILR
jgi:hypothetical protein